MVLLAESLLVEVLVVVVVSTMVLPLRLVEALLPMDQVAAVLTDAAVEQLASEPFAALVDTSTPVTSQ